MANTTVCVRMAAWLVLPDINSPGGMVRRRPGLRAMKRVVVTRRSVLVSTIPIAFAIREYTRKNTSAWKKIDIWSVPILPKDRFFPFVLSTIPGLRARKRAAGMATFWDVTSAIIFIIYKYIFSPDTYDILTKMDEIVTRGTSHHLLMETIRIHDSPDVFPHVQEVRLVLTRYPQRHGIVFGVAKYYEIA